MPKATSSRRASRAERARKLRFKPKISFVTIGARDFARSLAFYREGLGFKTHNYKEGDDHVLFRLDGSWLSLYPWDKLADDATVSADGSGFRGIILAHNVSSRKKVDETFTLAVAAGGQPVKQPQDVFWGGYSSYFADPDGVLWEIAWNPFTDLT
jgi:hypothetical protein